LGLQIEERAFPGHPGGQRPDRVNGLVGMETDPPLAGPLGVVVLDAESLEDPDRAVIHTDRQGHVKFTHGYPQDRLHTRIQMEYLCALIELLLCNCKRIHFGHKILPPFSK
jgi:hypothetical protein